MKLNLPWVFNMINFEEFSKVELVVGTILEAEEVEGSEKLIKQIVDFGELGKKQILSGIKTCSPFSGKNYTSGSENLAFCLRQNVKCMCTTQKLVGKQFVYVFNLEPRMMMGIASEGMLLATDTDKPFPIKPTSKVPAGTKLH